LNDLLDELPEGVAASVRASGVDLAAYDRAAYLVAEFVGRFLRERQALPAISLTTDTSALTAIANDYGFERVFARQVEALARPGDAVIAISTSGSSANVLAAVDAARAAGAKSIGITGQDGNELAGRTDVALVAATSFGPSIQEAHLAIEHGLCAAVELLLSQGDEQSKVVEWDQLLKLRDGWRRAGSTVVWTNGCFDLLHAGHVRSLTAARALGDVLVVGLNSDESARRLKGAGRPFVGSEQRAEVLAALEPVDHVVVFEEDTPEDALARLQPEIHTKGADYADRDIPERAVVESYGGRVELLPLLDGVSTTAIAERLGERQRV
jgi:rfaE bifunctional protein nucleotidyltransferase chain/domain